MTARRPLALIGFMACGKSTVGSLVAARTGACYHDLDAMVEAACGLAIADLFERDGEAAFRDLEARLLLEALAPGAVAALGGGTPLRDDSWALIRERAVSVWLDVPLPVVLDRVGPRADRPLLRGRDEAGLRALLEARLPRYREADHRVDASRPPEVVAEEVFQLWHG
ncbi:MAG TPA: shikimate kinase [Candidatus Dormibacteraeota bacterium]